MCHFLKVRPADHCRTIKDIVHGLKRPDRRELDGRAEAYDGVHVHSSQRTMPRRCHQPMMSYRRYGLQGRTLPPESILASLPTSREMRPSKLASTKDAAIQLPSTDEAAKLTVACFSSEMC